MAMANAIWYKTGEFLSVYVLDSEEVSRRTLLGTEQWEANKEFLCCEIPGDGSVHCRTLGV
jgi:hypothetical protein